MGMTVRCDECEGEGVVASHTLAQVGRVPECEYSEVPCTQCGGTGRIGAEMADVAHELINDELPRELDEMERLLEAEEWPTYKHLEAASRLLGERVSFKRSKEMHRLMLSDVIDRMEAEQLEEERKEAYAEDMHDARRRGEL